MKQLRFCLIIFLSLFLITACSDHTHTYDTNWSYDETTHFHKSTCGHDVVSDQENHNFDEGRITKEATETETGIKIYTCETCGYEKEETIEKLPHTHKFETVWSYDETTHFHKSTCGHDVVDAKADHNFDSGRITKEATETTNGTKIYTCETCGYEKEEVIPMIGPKTIYVNAYNTQDVTDGFGTYEGLELFKSGVTIGASLYWYKVAVVKSGNVYVVSEIAIEGKSLTKAYDYLFLSYKSESTGTYQKFLDLNLQLGDIVTFAVDPSTLEAGSVNLKVTFSKVEIKYHTLTLVAEGADSFTYEKDVIEGAVITLPKLTKPGYTFVGWYDNTNFTGSIYETITITSDITLYAKFEEKTYTDPLDYVSDVVTSNTIDELPSYMGLKTLTWKSSNPNLYTIDGNRGYTNRMYQTHQKQQVTITVYVLENGVTTEYSKTITINPVLFDTMTNPKSVYFAVGSASSYMKYNERYKTNKTLFSDKFKNHMDMVYYAFAVPQSDGSLTLNTLYLEEVMKLKNNGIRVLLVIDGANKAPLQAMVQLCNNDETRQTFVNSIVSLVQRYNFDGIDVDWEFPGISGLTGYTTEIDRTNLNKLLRDLRNKLNSIQDPDGSNYILSIAAPSTYWGVDRYDYDGRYSGSVGGINDYCDYVNMMSYDLNKSESTSHLSHLHIPSNSYSYKFAVDYGVSYFTSLGLDKNKIIIGSAAYGKAYNITGTVNQTAEYPALGVTGTLGQVSGYGLPGQSITWNSGTIYYTGIQTLIASGAFKQYDEYNNSNKFVGSYLYSSKDNVFITFDSKKAIEEKCKYAKANGLGIMVWAYGEDATDTIVDTICDNL
ncbi:MAG: glycosyl hydrolase family 18 protein [Bacilli bacterium]|nr:glycosyl hydrolase family 18 protein [Bacilli bacterium]